MKLKSLTLRGFKSFPDETELAFHEGLTVIVGPNGCGKSNISDAVRWVLGEQRPTAIRGAKMEEAIFQGTVARRAMNRGSVQMVVSNEDGLLPTPFQEVEISRTVFRDGGSDYRLNRASCRLRDIVDLCRDTGLGANAYSVIEIRMIDAILSERTEERRALFEEAAGIGKYKDRRRSALHRLDASEADLQRIADVIAEVRSKVRSLARQRGKAQRHAELKDRKLSLEVDIAKADLERLGGRLSEVDGELKRDRGQAAAAAAKLAQAEAALEHLRVKRVAAEKDRTRLARRMSETSSALAGVELDVAVAEERIANGTRRITQIRDERAEAARGATGLRANLETLKRERTQSQEALASRGDDLAAHRRKTARARERLDEVRTYLDTMGTRHRELERRLARAQGDRDGAQQQAKELALHLDRLVAASRQGAGALREARSQGDLFASRRDELAQQAQEADRELDQAGKGLGLARDQLSEARARAHDCEVRVAYLETNARAATELKDSWEDVSRMALDAAKALPEVVLGRLVDYVAVEGADPRVVDHILGRFAAALVVSDDAAADRVQRWYQSESGRRASLVLLPLASAPGASDALPDGVGAQGAGEPWVRALLGGVTFGDERRWRDRQGAIHLVADEGASGYLEKADRLATLERELDRARGAQRDAQRAIGALEEECARLQRVVDDASSRVLAARDAVRAGRARLDAETDRGQRLARDQAEVQRQLERARSARESAQRRFSEAAGLGDELRAEERALKKQLEEIRATHATVEAEWERRRQDEAEANVQAAQLDAECRRLDGRMEDNEVALKRLARRHDDLVAEGEALAKEVEAARRARSEGRRKLDGLLSRKEALKEDLSGRDRVLDDVSQAVREGERGIRALRDAERSVVSRRHQLELERQGIRDRVQRIGEQLEREWGRPVDELLSQATSPPEDLEAARGELAGIVDRLAKMGPVNMLAVEEHAEESARLEFLELQEEDLVKARTDLRNAVRHINSVAAKLFTESFEQIKMNFRDTFQSLFHGGEADLVLTDPDDPLESPVEIRAAPGGKRTKRIDLLSGGERALTALALLFGIYLVKPSPFCVLDEVDAPLDEANISRFIRMLQGFKAQTQFVVITHNPRTIEAADWVYGVTMEEPGVSSIVGVRLEKGRSAAVGASM